MKVGSLSADMHAHTKFVDGCFTCKLHTLNFGIVPGGYRDTTSPSMYDEATLPDFPSKEEVLDARSDYRKTPYKEIRLAETRNPKT